jgi:hypothetical protein
MSLLKSLIFFLLLTCIAPGAQAQAVKIIKPVEGQEVRPGETIKVQVQGTPGVETALLVVENPLVKPEDTKSPMAFTLTIPNDIPEGSYYIRAMAQANGEFIESEPRHITVKWPPNLMMITVDPLALSFDGAGESSQVKVLAIFAGDIVVESTRSSRTTYSSSDPYVVTIHPDGIATSLSGGKAVITVQTDTMKRTIPVKVGYARNQIKYNVVLSHSKPVVKKDEDGDFVVDFKGTNYSSVPLGYIKISQATLNGVPVEALPPPVLNVPLEGEFPSHLSFPRSAGKDGAIVELKIRGSYSPLPEEYLGISNDFELSYNVDLP